MTQTSEQIKMTDKYCMKIETYLGKLKAQLEKDFNTLIKEQIQGQIEEASQMEEMFKNWTRHFIDSLNKTTSKQDSSSRKSLER